MIPLIRSQLADLVRSAQQWVAERGEAFAVEGVAQEGLPAGRDVDELVAAGPEDDGGRQHQYRRDGKRQARAVDLQQPGDDRITRQ